MVVVYHGWTEYDHYISHLITSNNTVVFMTNLSYRPIGSLVNATKTIALMTDGSYDPTKVQIITPTNEFVVISAGEDINKTVNDIIIGNVTIQHSAWNMSERRHNEYQYYQLSCD